MKQSLSYTVIAASLMLAFGAAHAADVAESQVFALGEIKVSGTGDVAPATGGSTVSRQDMDDFQKETLQDALDTLPGVTIQATSQRNERLVHIRGFDSRQVPVFIDGIPVYVSYDGNVDMGRFTTYDIASIEVAKGFSSVLYGPNTLGGAVNLISRRPAKAFEGNIGVGIKSNDSFNSNGTSTNINLGTNQGMWYAQLGLSYLDRDAYTLSRNFQPTAIQPDRERRNSYSTDKKINIKVGLTPNATDEYSLNYIKQEGEKGGPPYAGKISGIPATNWQWPAWNKESLYFISNTAIGQNSYIKARAYYDKFFNLLKMTATQLSTYDDYSYGGSVEFGTKLSNINTFKVSVHMKDDNHEEFNIGEPRQRSRDRTTSIGIEDTHRLTEKLDVVVGASYDKRDGKQAQKVTTGVPVLVNYPPMDSSAFNPQVGLIYHISDTGNAYLTVARKSRFPTIKDRYSGGLGTNIPNPTLSVERAINYQLGISENINPALRVEAAVFYSEITNMIQSLPVPGTVCGTGLCNQNQNVGDVAVKGIELGLNNKLSNTLEVGGNYTYTHRENKSNPTTKLTDVPLSKFFAYAKWDATSKIRMTGNVVYRTHQYTSFRVMRDTPGFTVANAKLSYEVQKGVTLDFGVNNLFDRNYAYNEGFYEEGRNLFANLNYRF